MSSTAYFFAAGKSGTAITIYRGRARAADISTMFVDLDTHAAINRPPLLAIAVIEDESTLGKAGLELLIERMRSMKVAMGAWAIVIGRAGIWGMVTRTLANTVRLMSRGSYPFKVFSSVSEGVAFLQLHSAKQLSSLAAEVEQARAKLAAASRATSPST